MGTEESKEFASEHGDVNVEDLDDRLPYVVEGATLMSPGEWNKLKFSEGSLERAFQQTDWDDEEVVSLFNEHDDMDSRDWIGRIRNPRFNDGDVVGDIELLSIDEALKLAGGAEFGISPKVTGETNGNRVMDDFVFDNFSLVLNPAVKTTFLNSEVQTVHEAENSRFGEIEMSEEDVDVEEQEQETQSPELGDEDAVEALAGKVAEIIAESDLLEPETAENAEEEDADAEDDGVEEVEEDEEAEVEEEDVEASETSASEFEDFQEYVAARRDEEPELPLTQIAEEYEESQKDPSEKIDEVKQEFKQELEGLQEKVESLKKQQVDPEKLTQKTDDKEDREDAAETVREMSDKELNGSIRNMLLRAQGHAYLAGGA